MYQAQTRIYVYREEISYIMGQDLRAVLLKEEMATPLPVVGLIDVLARAQERRDVRAAREEVDARKYRICYERGFYWPTADVSGTLLHPRRHFFGRYMTGTWCSPWRCRFSRAAACWPT